MRATEDRRVEQERSKADKPEHTVLESVFHLIDEGSLPSVLPLSPTFLNRESRTAVAGR
jgi:hypothetical protein